MFFTFLRSLFITSGKFVDTENEPKFYITVKAVLSGVTVLSIKGRGLGAAIKRLTSPGLAKGFFVIGALQAVYGILQLVGKCPSNHNNFAVTGSFDNPAGFAAVLSLLFPIGVYWSVCSKKTEQKIVFFATGLMLFALVLSGSRTGILAAVAAGAFVLWAALGPGQKVKMLQHFRSMAVVFVLLLLLSSYGFYAWKKDSANGRLLIWKVSSEMIKEKPLFGFGHSGFQAHYMDYQARYFENNPHSKYSLLADNVKHPFNEFVQTAVNYGIAGLLLHLLLLVFVFLKILKTATPHKSMLLGVFVSFIVLSGFSYPLQYAPIWFLTGFFLLVPLSEKMPEKHLPAIVRMPIAGLCIAGLVFFAQRMHNEMKWKNIAVNSLQGKTKEMLPQYEKLYPKLHRKALFLYNYGAELNVAKEHGKSIDILKKCQKKFNDYDLQMLLADDYCKLGDTAKALRTYRHASLMIPCRFLPLYKQFEIYKSQNNHTQAMALAGQIQAKEVKIASATVSSIRREAQRFTDNCKSQ